MRELRAAVVSLMIGCVVLVGRTAEAGDAVGSFTPLQSPWSPRIVNGLYSSQYPSVGMLMDSSNFDVANMICSGTLIGCQTFLTAGHCVAGDLDPSSYSVFFQHAGFFSVASVTMRSDFNFPVGDVAIVKLTTPVTGIAPTPLDTTAAPAIGTPATIAGFGRSGGSNEDAGLKRVGDVTTASCTNGVSGTTSVCWNFSDPVGPPGTDSNTCNGDSGGPLFVDFGGGDTVAGVTSGGTSSNCLPTDNSYDANVFFYRAWIQAQGGADLSNTSCGSIPQVGQSGATVTAFSGQLSSATPQGTYAVTVSPGTELLRVSLNANDDGLTDFDLYVKQGSPPTLADYDCRQFGSNPFGFCQFTAPAAGTWYVLVNQYAGSGTYQVTATTFGGACSAPDSDGLPCDDNNVCTQNDTCAGGVCAGAAVSDGTPCDDGNVCTQPDTCQGGSCTSGHLPLSDCQQPFVHHRGLLQLEDQIADQKDRLYWLWLHGSQTDKTDFGNPLSTTDYTLCVYDETAGVFSPILGLRIPPGGTCGARQCWKESADSFRYSDRSGANSGIRSILLRAGSDGRAKISVRGRAGNVVFAPPLPLQQQNTVRVQLSNGTKCWESIYSTHIANRPARFEAKGD
jgi:hypothetical protein